VTETTFGSLASEARRSASNAAEGVSDAASRAAETTSDLASRAARVGDQAVSRLNDAAEYFREHEMNEIVSDLQSYVKTHPAQALLGAAALGFIAAVLLRRN
jgi:ElaB/YqjD/DUF883 family membrane-anchored ribosome-binding protein